MPVAEDWQEAEAEARGSGGPGECRILGADGVLRAEIAAKWQSDKTDVELIEEMRR